MVRRLSDRVYVEIDASIRKAGKKSNCHIRNVSEHHVCLKTTSRGTNIDLSPGTVVVLEFETPSAKLLEIPCTVCWSKKDSHKSAITKFCVMIEDNIPEFNDFYKDIFSRNKGML